MELRPLQQGLGAAKDKTKDFMNIKLKINTIRDPSKRFGQVTTSIAFDQFNSNNTNAQALTCANSQVSVNAKGQPKYAKFDDNIGFAKNELPPLWVDIQESIEDKISETEQQFEKLKQLRVQRFKPKFDEQENIRLDKQIDELVTNLTNVSKQLSQLNQAIKSSEKELRKMMSENSDAESDIQIRKNIQQTYLTKLKDIAKQLKQIEKENLMRIKELYGEEGEIILSQMQRKDRDFFAELDIIESKEQQSKQQAQLEHYGEVSQQRSEQINKLVSQMNELAVVFKELSTLAVEQGSILDRIDFNIEVAHTNVKKGNVQLEKTLKRENSWRAKGCMSCLVTWNLVLIGLLVFKHAV